MSSPKLVSDAAALLGELVAARNDLTIGRPIDLSALDLRVFALIDATLALPKVEAQELLPLLEDLRRALDTLGDALKAAEPSHA